MILLIAIIWTLIFEWYVIRYGSMKKIAKKKHGEVTIRILETT